MIEKLPTSDGSHTIHSERYGETYHSINGAYTEAQHVFLDATGVADRLKAGQATRVLEIGFGLGLNALLTADLANSHSAELTYHSYEHQLVDVELIRRLNYAALLKAPDLQKQLTACMDEPLRSTGHNRLIRLSYTSRIQLFIHIKNAAQASLLTDTGGQFDAVYLDAFSPACNPECWTREFFVQLREVMTNSGVLSTYSAKGDVSRAMLAAGMKAKKIPGPAGKREMLIARRE